MTPHTCRIHNVPLEVIVEDPISRCPNCHYATHHVGFEHCPECGRRMVIEEPEPRQVCPLCVQPARSRTEVGS